MQKLLLTTFITLLLSSRAVAQSTEVNAVLSTGTFAFTGASTAATSTLSYNEQYGTGYTYNPYGSKPSYCDGVALSFKRISKSRFLFGLEVGLEELRSKVNIDRIDGYRDTANYQIAASGRTLFKSTFLNFAPFIGYRHSLKSFTVDVSAGVDIAHCVSMKEDGQATDANGKEYHITLNRGVVDGDIRFRMQVTAYYRRFGMFIGYCYGITNYSKGNAGGSADCSSRLLRFGISYRLNSLLREVTAPL